MSEWVIRARELQKIFAVKGHEPVTALDTLNLDIPAGQMTALIGPDGAGKTTLMRLLCGLMVPTAGTLQVLGRDVTAETQAVQEQLSYMPQKFGLYEDLTVQENMELYAKLHGVPAAVRPQRFAHLLQVTGLTSFTRRLAGKLSGGMKQKLGLACTLVRSPKLLLLDEPTVGVDPLSRRELWKIVQQMVAEEQLSVLISTSYMDEAEQCDYVYILNKGRLLDAGTPQAIRENVAGCCYEVQAPAGIPLRVLQDRLLGEDRVLDAVPACGVIRLVMQHADADPDELKTLQALDLQAQPVSVCLEDAFMKRLKDDARRDDTGPTVPLQSVSTKERTVTAASPPIDIEVQDLVRKFGDFTAVAHTSFSVHRGEVFGLLGPNGAGKTTTFRMLCGLLPATSGRVRVAGVDLRKAPTKARANIGYVAQKFSLYGTLTVQENLTFYGGVYGLSKKKLSRRIPELLEAFGLGKWKDTQAAALPGGWKQRLSMAAALIHEPQILFLDEPTSGIDPLARRMFWQQITHLSQRGTTIIITTHFMDEAEYCDRFMIQDRGRLLILGSPAAIRQQMHMPHQNMNEIFIAIVEQARRKEGADADKN